MTVDLSFKEELLRKVKKNTESILIIANGKTPNKQLLQSLVIESDCIIAADGGSNICFKNNIYPDYIIGDFDSINNKIKSHFKNSEFIYRPEQDEHDLLKSLKFCDTLKPKKVVGTAVFGKRIDHTLSNMFILQNQEFKFPIKYVDDYSKVFIINKKQEFKLPPIHPISFLSYKPVFGVTLNGFKYEITGKDFPTGFNGVSNEVSESPASVTIKKGSLIAIVTHE
jgi:thiamine pyrophosphokinase